MAAPRRKFDNIDVELPDGDKIRLGTHIDKDELTVKLSMPGEWSIEWLGRGVRGATRTTLLLTRAVK